MLKLSHASLELLAAAYHEARGFGLTEANARSQACLRTRIRDQNGERINPIACSEALRAYIKGDGSKVLSVTP